jgi:hypothetical protein
MDKCKHENDLEYGQKVFQDSTTQVIQVRCVDCKAYGTVVELHDDDMQDYAHNSEAWHNKRDYTR